MRTSNYFRTADILPEPGEVVETVSPGGLNQVLRFSDGLWFFPDDGMYVYYTPMFWRPLPDGKE